MKIYPYRLLAKLFAVILLLAGVGVWLSQSAPKNTTPAKSLASTSLPAQLADQFIDKPASPNVEAVNAVPPFTTPGDIVSAVSNLPADAEPLASNLILANILRDAPAIDSATTSLPDGGWIDTIIYRTDEKYPYIRVETTWNAAGERLLEQAMVADHLLVRVKNPAEQAATAQRLEAAGLHVRHQLWTPGFILVSGPLPTVAALEQIDRSLSEQKEIVDFAEPDRLVFASISPDDTRYKDQWGLETPSDADIDATEAWDIQSGAPDIVVGVLDSGIDYNHPDLAANMWTNPGEIPGNGIDDDSNGLIDDVHGYDFRNDDGDPMDDHYHGTHVAGTIAAAGNNHVGVSGVAWQAQLMAVKFLSETGSGSLSDALDSIFYAYQMGADITNNSWGASGNAPDSLVLIIDIFSANIPFIAAAGNEAQNTDTSAHFPSSIDLDCIISVTAHDKNDKLAYYSNYGAESVDLSAPGSSILSTMPNGAYTYLSGTSMAAPHVAGSLALLMQRFPDLTPLEAKNMLLESAVPRSYLTGKTLSGGRLNLAALLNIGSISPPVITSAGQATAVIANDFTFSITADNDPDTFNAIDLPDGLVIDSTTGIITGIPTTVGIYPVTVSATNFAGTDEATLTITVEQIAPVITSSLTASVDLDSALNYQITAINGVDSFAASGLPTGLSIDPATGLISGTPTVAGEFAVTLEATNAIGTGTASLTLTVIPPPIPVITNPLATTGTEDIAFNYQITASNIPTSFNAAGLPSGLSVDTNTGLISGTPITIGEFNVTISATNPGGTGEATLVLTINLPIAPVITAPATINTRVGNVLLYQISASNVPTVYDAEGLPAGLTLNPASGAITGTPTEDGIFSVKLSAANAGGTGLASVVIDVLPLKPVVTSATQLSTHAGDLFSYSITASNLPTSFNATGLPTGLTIDQALGTITGTPTTVGTFPIAISATNRGGVGSTTLYLQILPQQPEITSALVIEAEAGEVIAYQITATNTPSSFGATNLPTGLTIDTGTGLINGTVLVDDDYPITISATNAGGTATETLMLTILDGPTRIFSFTPVSIDPEGEITITGTGFTDATQVIFATRSGEVPATSFTVISDEEIRATVPYIHLTSQDRVRMSVISPRGLGAALPPNTVEVYESGEVSSYPNYIFRIHDGVAVTGGDSQTTFFILRGGIATTEGRGIYHVQGGGVLDMTNLSYNSTVYYTPESLLLDAPIVGAAYNTTFINVPYIRSSILAESLWINQTPQVTSPLTDTIAVGEYYKYELKYSTSSSMTDISVGTLPDGLSFNTDTRILSGYPTTPGDYNIDFTLSNSQGTNQATLALSITGDAIPVITNTGSFALNSGEAFELQITAANSPTSFGATGLPGGLSIDTDTGLITGTPTVSGVFLVTLSATNALGTGQHSLAFYVDDSPITITDMSPVRAKEGSLITVNGTGFNEVLAVKLINAANQMVTVNEFTIVSDTEITFIAPQLDYSFRGYGSPIILEAANIAAVSYDDVGVVTSRPLAKIVASGEILDKFGLEEFHYVEAGGTVKLVNNNGTGRILFLQDGATFDMNNIWHPSSIVIASPGANFINIFTDAYVTYYYLPSMRFFSVGKSLSIYNPPYIDPVDAAGVVGQTFNYQITLIESESISSYNATGLPPGLSVSSNGVITGTPTTAGVYTVTLSAASSGNSIGTGTAEVIFTITEPTLSTLTSDYRIDGAVGEPLTYQITASNAPSAFQLGTLPAGLSYDSGTGLISGTPTEAGGFPIALTITNAGGDIGYTLFIAIDAPMPHITDIPEFAIPGQIVTADGDHLAQVSQAYFTNGTYATTPIATTIDNLADDHIDLITPDLHLGIRRESYLILNAPGGHTVSLPADMVQVTDITETYLFEAYYVASGGTLIGGNGSVRIYAAMGSQVSLEGGFGHLIFAENGATISVADAHNTTTIYYAPNAHIDAPGATLIPVNDIAPSFVANGLEMSPLPFITSNSQARGFTNIPFFFTITASNSPTGFAASGLPAGLSINPTTGAISGTPTTASTYSVTLTVTNANGSSEQFWTLYVGNALDYWVFQNFGDDTDSNNIEEADSNGDGISDLITYATGGNLSNPTDRSQLPTFEPAAGNSATFQYRRLVGSGAGSTVDGYSIGGVTYIVYWSDDLSAWQTGNVVLEEIGDPIDNGDGTETVTVGAKKSLTECTSFFLLDIVPTP